MKHVLSIYNPIPNKYYKWYISIITKAQSRGWTKKTAPCYVESHHIIPKSLGGDNSKENLICLTAKEHYICHHLLTKFLDGESKFKMAHAFWRLCLNKNRTEKITASQYKIAKNIFSTEKKGKKQTPETILKRTSKQIGKPLTEAHKENIRLSKIGTKMPLEAIERSRSKQLGKKLTKEHIEKIVSKTRGQKRTTETKEKMRISHLKRWQNLPKEIRDEYKPRLGSKQSEETRDKIRKRHLGKKFTEERKNFMRGWHHTKEAKNKIRVSSLGRNHNEDTKAILREKAIYQHFRKFCEKFGY